LGLGGAARRAGAAARLFLTDAFFEADLVADLAAGFRRGAFFFAIDGLLFRRF
jgi:hypothetical protein